MSCSAKLDFTRHSEFQGLVLKKVTAIICDDCTRDSLPNPQGVPRPMACLVHAVCSVCPAACVEPSTAIALPSFRIHLPSRLLWEPPHHALQELIQTQDIAATRACMRCMAASRHIASLAYTSRLAWRETLKVHILHCHSSQLATGDSRKIRGSGHAPFL